MADQTYRGLLDPLLTRIAALEARVEEIEALLARMDRTHGPRVSDANNLYPRQIDVLKLIAAGMSQAEIAERLNLTKQTINTTSMTLRRKVGCTNNVQLALWAVRNGYGPESDEN